MRSDLMERAAEIEPNFKMNTAPVAVQFNNENKKKTNEETISAGS